MNNRLLSAFILLLFLLGGIYLYNRFRVPPDIRFLKLALEDLKGSPANFESFKGHKTIVCFSASWCGNCWQELEAIERVKDSDLGDVEVVVISDEPADRIERFISKKAFPFTFLKLKGTFADIGVHSLPTSYIINSDFKVTKESVGYLHWDDPSTLAHLKKLME